MNIENEPYLKQQLERVKFRIKILDAIEARLTEMRSIAVLSMDSNLPLSVRKELNERFHALEKEVNELDAQELIQ